MVIGCRQRQQACNLCRAASAPAPGLHAGTDYRQDCPVPEQNRGALIHNAVGLLQHAVCTGSAVCGARLLAPGTLPPGLAGFQDCHVPAVCTVLLTRPAAVPGSGGSPGMPAPETPPRSFTGAETLGAGLESLRAPSQQSASASAEDPEAGRQLLASRPGSASGILSQGRGVVSSLDWATVPAHH